MINEIIETVQAAAGGSFIARMRVSETSATAGQDAAWLSHEHAQAKDKVGHWLRREAIRFAAADEHQHQSISRVVLKGHKEVARRKVDSHYTKTTDEDPGKDDNQTTDDLEAAETCDPFEPVVLEQVGSMDVNIATERVLQGNTTDALLATLNSIVFDDLEEQVTNNDQ